MKNESQQRNSAAQSAKLGDENGPGPSASTLGEFRDLTTQGVASDR